jgi:hypothetical protein
LLVVSTPGLFDGCCIGSIPEQGKKTLCKGHGSTWPRWLPSRLAHQLSLPSESKLPTLKVQQCAGPAPLGSSAERPRVAATLLSWHSPLGSSAERFSPKLCQPSRLGKGPSLNKGDTAHGYVAKPCHGS